MNFHLKPKADEALAPSEGGLELPATFLTKTIYSKQRSSVSPEPRVMTAPKFQRWQINISQGSCQNLFENGCLFTTTKPFDERTSRARHYTTTKNRSRHETQRSVTSMSRTKANLAFGSTEVREGVRENTRSVVTVWKCFFWKKLPQRAPPRNDAR